jgi:NADPH2:quinone reductase
MRAVIVEEFGPIENAVLRDAPDPLPRAGEILIEVHVTAANYVDILLIGGRHQSRPPLPYIPGKGPAGLVRALGPGVTGFNVGDRVLGMCEPGGGYAELIAVPATQCHRLPDSMGFVDAASMALVFDTAWFAIRERGRYQPGETVLVLGGSGGVGLAAIQLARALGAKVLAGVSNPDKYDLAREAGADAIIELGRPGLHDSLREQVYAVTDGRGADIIIDPLGDAIFDAAIRALAWCGRMVIIGFAAGRIPTVKANYLLVRNIDVCGLQIGDYRKRTPHKTAACFRELFALYERGIIRPLPTTTMPIERVGDALRAIRDRTARGRIVLLQTRAKQ